MERSGFCLQIIGLILCITMLMAVLNPDSRIDINKASRSDLEAVPGIGPSTAKRIIHERDRRRGFRSLNDLMKIRGIGRKKIQKFKEYLKVVPVLVSNKPGSVNP